METLASNGIGEGGRDNALFHYTVYAKKKWPSEWKNKIILFNEKVMNPPLDDASVERIKEQHDKKEWGYKCKDEPMCSFCDKELCRTRKYGIGGMALFPVLSDLQKIELDEPYYYVNVDGQRVKLDNVETLLSKDSFKEQWLNKLIKDHQEFPLKNLDNTPTYYLQALKKYLLLPDLLKLISFKNILKNFVPTEVRQRPRRMIFQEEMFILWKENIILYLVNFFMDFYKKENGMKNLRLPNKC